jgi:hypothetical protein
MPWQLISQITLTEQWQLTPPISGEIFRIKHSPIFNPNKQYLKAVISPAFIDDGINLLKPQRLSYRDAHEVFTFYFPQGIAQQQLAFKRLDSTYIDWHIEAEIFYPARGEEDFANYLITRFGELMPLFNEISLQGLEVSVTNNFPEIRKSNEKYATSTTPVAILIERTNRETASIYNSGSADITVGFLNLAGDAVDSPLAIIKPNGIYELPAGFANELYAVSATASEATVTDLYRMAS